MELVNMIKLGTMGYKPADIKQINASGIDSEQIIELAKSGYAASDVNELIKLAQEPTQTPPEKKEPEAPPEKPEAKPEIDELNNKIKELTGQLEEAQTTIKKIQSDNANINLGSGNRKSARELVQESLRNLY